jgi:cytochrome c peroxidase
MMRTTVRAAALAALAAVGFTMGATSAPRAEEKLGILAAARPLSAERAVLADMMKKYRRPLTIPHPEDNQLTAPKEMLGRTLFFDPRLSGSNFISCATCHNPAFSWGDGNPRAIGDGMKTLGRRTPTILNLAWVDRLFWDGRAGSLEEQALGPIEAAGEMNMPLDQMLAKLENIGEYRPLFERAFPGEGITKATVAKAIAAYERTIVSGQAPFDRWAAGDESAVSPAAKRGFVLFNAKANCASCHAGWSFTDGSFHDIGVRGGDLGRGAHLKRLPKMQHAFKTPTLRNVDRRAPYMHDGSEPTLEATIEFYDRGGDVQRPGLSSEMRPLGLTAGEKADLLAFLRTLTSEDAPAIIPSLPR